MSSLTIPYFDKIQAFAHFITPESASSQDEIPWRPIISVKTDTNQKQIQNNRQRTTWHFLTLGIPLMIEALSVFWSGLIHRETVDLPLRVRFKFDRLPQDKIGQLIRFHQFNQISCRPLNKAAENKALALMTQLINRLEKAKNESNLQEQQECRGRLNSLRSVLEKQFTAKMSRSDFNEEDWAIADQIDYELAYDYFAELTDLFNTDWMSSSNLRRELKADLGIDYQESVMAENLALSLSYIEGLDGKTISLPVYDKTLGKFLSVAYTIKLTTIGDSLPCYILESTDPQINPWMIVRGTQPYIGVSVNNKEYRMGGLESLLADSIDPECISRNVINKALTCRPIVNQNGTFIQKESLSDIFRKWKQEGKQVKLSGHSLGGTLVNALTVEFYDQIKKSYAFSGAGVSIETAQRWEMLNQKHPALALDKKLINFDYEGDIIPAGGRRLIGTHLAIEPLVQLGPSGIYDCHVRSHLNHDFQIQKIDVKKETSKLVRVFCERLRIVTGKCFLLLLWFFSNKYMPDWWKNRNVYRERAAFERDIRALI